MHATKFSYRTVYILLNAQLAPLEEKMIHNKMRVKMRILQKCKVI